MRNSDARRYALLQCIKIAAKAEHLMTYVSILSGKCMHEACTRVTMMTRIIEIIMCSCFAKSVSPLSRHISPLPSRVAAGFQIDALPQTAVCTCAQGIFGKIGCRVSRNICTSFQILIAACLPQFPGVTLHPHRGPAQRVKKATAIDASQGQEERPDVTATCA